MEGLIKGLIDAALGIGDRDDTDNDNRNETEQRHHRNHNEGEQRHRRNDDDDQYNSPSLEERSRSTWAQVVSGEQGEGDAHDYVHSPWNRKAQVVSGEQEEGGAQYNINNPWNRKSQEEDAEKNDGDWETAGKRPPRRPHKVSTDYWHAYKRPPSEQEYSDEVDYGADIEPSEEELADLSRVCDRLWELDSNRLVPGKDYEIDCGEGKKAYQKGDMAQGSLFSWLGDDIFRRPTYSRFCSLLDNYNPNEGCKEVVTSQERQEQAAFIEEISRTAPVKYLHKYLVSKGISSHRYEDFKKMMTDLWFDLYGRAGTSSCSSAFEHVFVGEIKQRGEQEVSGFHNWIQFYMEEAKGRVDYQGYIFPRRHGQIPDSEAQLLTIQFEWNGILKSVSSTLVGVSPEFEIALYTLCFYVGEEDNHIQLGPYPVNIKCYRMGRDKIGSVFPIAEY